MPMWNARVCECVCVSVCECLCLCVCVFVCPCVVYEAHTPFTPSLPCPPALWSRSTLTKQAAAVTKVHHHQVSPQHQHANCSGT